MAFEAAISRMDGNGELPSSRDNKSDVHFTLDRSFVVEQTGYVTAW